MAMPCLVAGSMRWYEPLVDDDPSPCDLLPPYRELPHREFIQIPPDAHCLPDLRAVVWRFEDADRAGNVPILQRAFRGSDVGVVHTTPLPCPETTTATLPSSGASVAGSTFGAIGTDCPVRQRSALPGS